MYSLEYSALHFIEIKKVVYTSLKIGWYINSTPEQTGKKNVLTDT